MSRREITVIIPCLYGGGAERAALRLSLQLSNEHHVTLLRMEKGLDYQIPDKLKTFQLSGLDGRAHPALKVLYFPIQMLRLLIYISRNRQESTLITFTERASFLGTSIKLFYPNLYLIVSFRNFQSIHIHSERMTSIMKALRKFVYNRMFRNIDKLSDQITTLAHAAKIDLKDSYGIESEKVEVIYNEYDVNQIMKESEEILDSDFSALCENNEVLINVGRLEKQKGQKYLIRVMGKIKSIRPNVKLVILGVGGLKASLQEECEKLGLRYSDSLKITESVDVYFLGFAKNPFPYIKASKLFVFSSLWEGFGNALFEAMASGAAVVSADCSCGPREMIAPKSNLTSKTTKLEVGEFGFLLPDFLSLEENDVEEESRISIWTESIDQILSNPDLISAFRHKSIKGARNFDVGSQIYKWKSLIDKRHW